MDIKRCRFVSWVRVLAMLTLAEGGALGASAQTVWQLSESASVQLGVRDKEGARGAYTAVMLIRLTPHTPFARPRRPAGHRSPTTSCMVWSKPDKHVRLFSSCWVRTGSSIERRNKYLRVGTGPLWCFRKTFRLTRSRGSTRGSVWLEEARWCGVVSSTRHLSRRLSAGR